VIVFSRHGNTFAAGERAVWVGARSDLPLVSEGFLQAERVADHLRENGLAPTRIVTGPLRRTREFADVIARAFGAPVEIDDGLREIDYGHWEGLDNAEVVARFGEDVLRAWEDRLAWPGPESGWGESDAEVADRVRGSLARLAAHASPVYACTSNGILRYVRRLVDGATDSRIGKVRTGAICALDGDADAPTISMWNHSPRADRHFS
jgi:probable phosphoglycerate mutase